MLHSFLAHLFEGPLPPGTSGVTTRNQQTIRQSHKYVNAMVREGAGDRPEEVGVWQPLPPTPAGVRHRSRLQPPPHSAASAPPTLPGVLSSGRFMGCALWGRRVRFLRASPPGTEDALG